MEKENFYARFYCSCDSCKENKSLVANLYLSFDFNKSDGLMQVNIWDFRNKDTGNEFLFINKEEAKKIIDYLTLYVNEKL
jgi:hypothetical protein